MHATNLQKRDSESRIFAPRSNLSRVSWLSYALHRIKRGKMRLLFQLSTFEDQNASRGVEELARDRQPRRTSTNNDKVRLDRTDYLERAKIFNLHLSKVG